MKSNRTSSRTGQGKGRGNNNPIGRYLLLALIVAALVGALYGIAKNLIDDPPVITEIATIDPVSADGSGVEAVIVLDCSSSMRGYADAYPNNYLDVLSDLLSFYPDATNAVINSGTVKGKDLIDNIRLHKIAYTKQSYINQDLEGFATKVLSSIKSKSKTQPLFLYITDGIMSGSDMQISKDAEYNRIHAQDLKNQIVQAFNGKEAVGVSVYQFKSRFKGEYWAYDNEHHPIDSERYFYVFAIAPRPVLADLKQKVDSKKSDPTFCFRPLAQWHAIDDKVISSGLVVGPTGAVNEKNGIYTYDPKHINNNYNGLIEFSVNASYLRNHSLENMKTLADKTTVAIGGHTYQDIKVVWDSVAGALSFKVPINYLTDDSVTVSIPRLEQQWIPKSTINPKDGNADKYIFSRPDCRTFLLQELMNGLQNGVYGGNEEYIYVGTAKLKRK